MSETDAPHPDDIAVDRFAAAMKAKLAKKRAEGYGGWDNPEECTIERLSRLLINHLAKGDPIDIGNFAMMIHQRGASIVGTALESAEPKLFGPYGYLNGCRALTEDTWVLENDPLENNDEYFSIPLYAKVDISFPVSIGAPTPHPHPLAAFPDGLKPGLYIIHWKDGGTSQAAIGMQSDGSRWIAPTNWLAPGLMPSAGEWGEIESVELITPASDIVALKEALTEAEPYVEICHSLMTQKETRANVWRVLKQVRSALSQQGESRG